MRVCVRVYVCVLARKKPVSLGPLRVICYSLTGICKADSTFASKHTWLTGTLNAGTLLVKLLGA